MHEIILRAVFTGDDAEIQALDLKAQIDARMTNTSVGDPGGPGEHTSYVRHENNGVLVSMSHIDEFGILRDGEYIAPDPYPEWIAPTGAHDSYPALTLRGDPVRVVHNGATWENSHGDGNSWEPGVFGWTEV